MRVASHVTTRLRVGFVDLAVAGAVDLVAELLQCRLDSVPDVAWHPRERRAAVDHEAVGDRLLPSPDLLTAINRRTPANSTLHCANSETRDRILIDIFWRNVSSPHTHKMLVQINNAPILSVQWAYVDGGDSNAVGRLACVRVARGRAA